MPTMTRDLNSDLSDLGVDTRLDLDSYLETSDSIRDLRCRPLPWSDLRLYRLAQLQEIGPSNPTPTLTLTREPTFKQTLDPNSL